MARLRRADCSGPGIRRARRGRGFTYLDEDGDAIEDTEVVQRIRGLGIPPAWEDVWICPSPRGHIQATGIDVAGRKQYLYHEEWRRRRDQEKFDEMLDFARDLPDLRARIATDMESGQALTRERVLACAVRLLDRGFFRIGTEEYAVANESFGLATMRKTHVRLEDDDTMVFDYPAKHGKRQVRAVVDPLAMEVVGALKRRRGGGPELLAYKNGRRWYDIRSTDINDYIKEVTGADYSAKDFRTWNATVLAAVALGVSGAVVGSKTGRKRAVTRAVKEVSHYLGNTPAVCRASYIDPRVFDAFDGGLTVSPALQEAAGSPGDVAIHQPELERAVIDLIGERSSAPGVEKLAA
jgi:DNA topoisomerase-1